MLASGVSTVSGTNSVPGYDYANKGTLVGLLKELQDAILKNTDDMLPATVIAYDRQSNIATVQPSIYTVTMTGQLVKKAQIASVPVLALGGGGFFIGFPLAAGARGWIKANDRDISLYLQAGQLAAPNSQRLHSFSNGLFIPDIVSGYTIADEDVNNMVIQNLAGTVKVSLGAAEVKITAAIIDLEGTLIINGVPFLSYKPAGVQGGDGEGSGLVAP